MTVQSEAFVATQDVRTRAETADGVVIEAALSTPSGRYTSSGAGRAAALATRL
jgi:hypothetical protein